MKIKELESTIKSLIETYNNGQINLTDLIYSVITMSNKNLDNPGSFEMIMADIEKSMQNVTFLRLIIDVNANRLIVQANNGQTIFSLSETNKTYDDMHHDYMPEKDSETIISFESPHFELGQNCLYGIAPKKGEERVIGVDKFERSKNSHYLASNYYYYSFYPTGELEYMEMINKKREYLYKITPEGEKTLHEEYRITRNPGENWQRTLTKQEYKNSPYKKGLQSS